MIEGYYLMPHPPLIIPEIGCGDEEALEETKEACTRIANEIANIKPKTIVLVTPHGPVMENSIVISMGSEINGNLEAFGAKKISFKHAIDSALSKRICDLAKTKAIHMTEIDEQTHFPFKSRYYLDHGAIVPLYFINQVYSDFQIVHITYGLLNKYKLYQLGMLIRQAIQELNRDVVFVASGDLSHVVNDFSPYGFKAEGPIFDGLIQSALDNSDTEKIFQLDSKLIYEAKECGLRTLYILLGLLDGWVYVPKLKSYEAPYGVGYATYAFELVERNKSKLIDLVNASIAECMLAMKVENESVILALESILYYLFLGEQPLEKKVSVPLKSIQKGVFVSLKINGELRGCIGTVFPRKNCIRDEIIENAIEAAFFDPRFMPLTEEEIFELSCSVDVLSPLEKITQIDQLDPYRYGLVVKQDELWGVLLPNLKGIESSTMQLELTLRKAGIVGERYEMYRFTTERFQ